MTTEASYSISASPAAFRAAIAVLSHGRRLSEPTTALLRRLMEEEGLPPETLDDLMAACHTGLRPAQADDVRFTDPAEAVVFLTALTQFALRTSPNWREALFLPELIASHLRLPYDVVHRMASRVGPDLEAIHPERLEANLRAFLHPGEDTRAIATWITESLTPATPDRRTAATVPTSSFQHPLDTQAIEMVRGFAGFDELTRLVFEHGIEKMVRVVNLSSAIRVGPDQFPELYDIYRACVERAGIVPEPELYVCPGGLNAHTSGVDRPYVMLNAGAVNMLDRAELEYIIGHELGHIRCQHMLYLFMANYLPMIASFLPMVGPWISMGLRAALGEWKRKAELSCDRMGLLVSQDLEACLRVMVKCSGAPGPFHHRIDLDAFLRQAEEFRNLDQDLVSGIFKCFANLGNSHPWTVERAYELKRWHDEGGYAQAFAAGHREETPTYLPRPMLNQSVPPEAEVVLTAPEAAVVPRSREERLEEALSALEAGLVQAGDEALATAVGALRTPREPGPFRAVVVGEKGRGKSTLIARLGAIAGTELRDTPPLNDPENRYDELVMATAVKADALLVVVSATQLLSERERELIRERLLPAAGDRLALVVTHMDLVEDDEDRTYLLNRVRRFTRQLNRPELPVFFLDGGPQASAGAIATWLREAAEAHEGVPEDTWRRASGLLTTVQLAIGRPQTDPTPPAERERAIALLRTRHGTALAEAEAHLAARLATLRLGLPGRIAPAEVPLLVENVQRLGYEAIRVYRDGYARALMADAPDAIRSALGPMGTGYGPSPIRHLGQPTAPQAADHGRHPALTTFTALGAGLLVLTGGALPIVGALALGTAHELRRGLESASHARTQEEAAAALAAWLTEAERQLVSELRAVGEQSLEMMTRRIELAFSRQAEPDDRLERLRRLTDDALTLCREALAERSSNEE